jgi:hypothetical protein
LTPANINPFSAQRFSLGPFGWIEGAPGEMDAWATAVASGRRAFQVLGPHGAGKSTLLVHLERALGRRGLSIVRFRCGRGIASALRTFVAHERRPDVVLADEAQSWAGARLAVLRAASRALGASLVVSTHVDLGFSTLSERRVSPALAARIISALAGADRVPPPEELGRRLEAHRGNLREVFFGLYDEFEANRQRPRDPRPPRSVLIAR